MPGLEGMSWSLSLQNSSFNVIVSFTLCAKCGWMPLYFMSRDHGISPPNIAVYIVAIHRQIDVMYISPDFTLYGQQHTAQSALHRLAERIRS